MQRLGLPASLWWFVITAVVFGLQLFPIPGIFLMMLAAPFWSVFTINFGFLSLAAEALQGRINRLWLIAPIAWFGGYAVLTTLSHIEASRPEPAMDQHIAFDPSRESLILDQSSRLLNSAKLQLLAHYPLDVVYTVEETARGIRYLAYRLGSAAICQSIKGSTDFREAGIRIEPTDWVISQAIGDMCVYVVSEEPKLDPVVVSASYSKSSDLLLGKGIYLIEIDGSDRRLSTSISAPALPLSWLPIPVIGCYLNDQFSTWRCGAEFWREQPKVALHDNIGVRILDRIAKALSLTPNIATERRAEIDAAPPPDFKALVDARLKTFTDALDAAISDPSRRLTRRDVQALFEKPDLVAHRADAIVGAIRSIFDSKRNSYATAKVLEDLLVTLPWSQFEPAGGSLLSELSARGKFKSQMFSDAFVARLGDFGAPALPILDAIAFSGRPFGADVAVIGLCRSGEMAAPYADKLKNLLMSTKRTDPAHIAAFVALLRLGRHDLASTDPDVGNPGVVRRYADALNTITPDSPASVCDTTGLTPKIPDRGE